jgi:hypothetical protein
VGVVVEPPPAHLRGTDWRQFLAPLPQGTVVGAQWDALRLSAQEYLKYLVYIVLAVQVHGHGFTCKKTLKKEFKKCRLAFEQPCWDTLPIPVELEEVKNGNQATVSAMRVLRPRSLANPKDGHDARFPLPSPDARVITWELFRPSPGVSEEDARTAMHAYVQRCVAATAAMQQFPAVNTGGGVGTMEAASHDHVDGGPGDPGASRPGIVDDAAQPAPPSECATVDALVRDAIAAATEHFISEDGAVAVDAGTVQAAAAAALHAAEAVLGASGERYMPPWPQGPNKDVVCHSPTLTFCVRCNTSINPTTSEDAARCSVFYLAKYCAKEGQQLAEALPLLLDAFAHIKQYPSRAEDTGQDARTLKHLLTRAVNTMGKEISVTTVALCLLQHPHEDFSGPFAYCHIRPAVAAVLASKRPATSGALGAEGEASDDGDGGPGDGDPVDTDTTAADLETLGAQEAPKVDPAMRSDEGVFTRAADTHGQDGLVDVVRVYDADTKKWECRFVPQHDSYRWRGPGLAALSYYEYCACVKIVKVVRGGGDEEDAGVHAGRRQSNARFPFDREHPMYGTHCQQLRSKFAVPILCGPRPPRHPGVPKGRVSRAKRAALDEFAGYYITLFVPWDLATGRPGLPLTFAAFVAWFQFDAAGLPKSTPHLRQVQACAWMSINSFPARCAREVVTSMEASLSSSKRTNWLLTNWRFRTATPWEDFDRKAMEGAAKDLEVSRDGMFEFGDVPGVPLNVAAARAVLQHQRDLAATAGASLDCPPTVAKASHHRDDTVVNSLMALLAAGRQRVEETTSPAAGAGPGAGLEPGPHGDPAAPPSHGMPPVSVSSVQAAADALRAGRRRGAGAGPAPNVDPPAEVGEPGAGLVGGHREGVGGPPGPSPHQRAGPAAALPARGEDVGRAGGPLVDEAMLEGLRAGDIPASPEQAQEWGPPGAPCLTAEQFAVCTDIWRWQRGGCKGELKLVLQGAAGTGKTLLLSTLERFLPLGFVEYTATTGVASVQLGNGARTTHSSCKFNGRGGKKSKQGTDAELYCGQISDRTEHELAMNYPPHVNLLVVDEMSMYVPKRCVTCVCLCALPPSVLNVQVLPDVLLCMCPL